MTKKGHRGAVSPELASQLTVLSALEKINRAILSASNLKEMLSQVLDEMLCLFDCQRAWLVRPCDPQSETFQVPMERCRPGWPGAGASEERLPVTPFVRRAFREALKGPCLWGGFHEPLDPEEPLVQQFTIRSMMFIALRPRKGPPWLLGLHHCVEPRRYDTRDVELMEAVGARLTDGLTGFLAQQESQADKRRLEEAQHLAQVGSYEWTPEGGWYLSNELCHLMGHDGPYPDNFEILISYIHESDREKVAHDYDYYRRHGGSYDFQCRALRDAVPGSVPWILRAKGVISLDSEGSLVRIMGVVQDVTETVQLEAQLRQAQKMESLGQLTGGVAHDFNNLLTVILGNLSEVEHLSTLDEVRPLLKDVGDAASNAAELTQMLTTFARKQPLRPRVLNVNGLLTRLEALLVRTLGESISFEFLRDPDLWCCEIDASLLENSLLNLALNARDAMPDGGKLTIETGNVRIGQDYADQHLEVTPGPYVLIALTDSGIGMDEATIARVFEPFFTTKKLGHGTGLGLSMVYGFVKQSGGHLKLYSEPGEGTTAKIYLPRSMQDEEDPSVESRPVTPQGMGQLILIVEDDKGVRNLTVRLVESLGYLALVAEDTQDAIRLANTNPDVALLFTDVMLPGDLNGAQLAQKIQDIRPGLPVLYTSGYTKNAIVHQGRLDPGVSLLEKPFTRTTLGEHLAMVLAAHSNSKSAE